MEQNETIRTIMQRRSTRAYADTPIDDEKKKAIIDAARRAPTAGNMQLYSMIVVEDQELKNKLSKSCDNQPFIAKAPLVIIYLADFHKLEQLYKSSGAPGFMDKQGKKYREPGVGELVLSIDDAIIAAQNSVIAAESFGIGSCYIGDIMEQHDYHKELLNLPDHVFPATMLCFGYPRVIPQGEKKLLPRFGEEFVVFTDTYKQFDDTEILHLTDDTEKLYKTKGQYSTGAENPGQHMCARKYITDYSLELQDSFSKYLKQWKKSE